MIRGLVRACHPEPTAAGTGATVAGYATLAAIYVVFGLSLNFVLGYTGQLSIGWLNDLLDAPRDRAVGRRDKPVVSGEVTVAVLRVATALAVVACVPLSLYCGLVAGAVHLVAVAAGWVYDLGGKSTWWSVVPYVVCFGLLPAFVVLALPGAPLPPWWLPVAGALLGAGAHFANVLPTSTTTPRRGCAAFPTGWGAGEPGGRRGPAAGGHDGGRGVGAAAAGGSGCGPGCGCGRPRGWFRGPWAGPFRAVLAVAVLAVAMLLASGPALVS